MTGSSGNDWLLGGRGADHLSGADGADTLLGDAPGAPGHGDRLGGGAGNDTLDAGAGADTARGGKGKDLVRLGGADGAADLHVVAPGTGPDRVLGFVAGRDRIGFEGLAPIPEARFVAGDSPRAPSGAGPALLYDTATGRLWLDLDGRGGAPPEPVAVLVGGPALTHADILRL